MYIDLFILVGELLSKTSKTFDPLNVLLRRDVWISKQLVSGKVTQILNVRLKSSKESLSTTRGIVVEVIRNKDFYSTICRRWNMIFRFLKISQYFAL